MFNVSILDLLKVKKSSPVLFLIGAVLIFALFASYSFYAQEVKRIDYEIFDLGKTVSWEKSQKGIFRVDSKGDFEILLLSKDAWRDFEISFALVNPRNCGFVFNYRNEKNYCLIFLNSESQSLGLLQIKEGAAQPLERAPLSYNASDSYLIKVNHKSAALVINGKPVFEVPLLSAGGNVGLLLRDSSEPKTYFGDVIISGHIASGRAVDSAYKDSARLYPVLAAVVILYFSLMVFCFYLALVFNLFLNRNRPKSDVVSTQRNSLPAYAAVLAHLLLTVFIFYPFVTRGNILVSSTDNFGEILPLFLFSKHNFWNIIMGQSLCLWNPYNLDGMPFFSNHWNMIYYPLNWVVFLFSDKHVLPAMTFRVFLEVLFLGLCAYGLFVRELGSRSWALFCSITYQLCSFLIFSFTIFPTISLFFSMTLFLYLVWSMPGRRMSWNFLLLAAAATFILTSANVAFIFYAFVSILVISVYRILSVNKEIKSRLRNFSLVGASILTGFLIAAVRIIPCAFGIADSNRIAGNFFSIHDRFFMLVRLFSPSIAGQYGLNALASDNLNFVYKQATIAANDHNTFFVYFGILPALLLLLNLFIKTKGCHRFWKIYTFTALAIGLLFQPFWGVLSILFFPFNHHMYQIVILPIGIVMLAGYTGIYLEKNKLNLNKTGNSFFAVLAAIQALVAVIVVYLFPSLTPYVRLILIFVIFWLVVRAILKQCGRKLYDILLLWGRGIFLILLWVAIFFISAVSLAGPIAKKEGTTEFLTVPFMLLLAVVFTAAQISIYMRSQKIKTAACNPVVLHGALMGMAIMIGLALIAPLLRKFLDVPDFDRAYFINMFFDQIIFFSVVALGIIAVALHKIRALPRNYLVYVFIAVTAFDLMVFNARFDYISAPPPTREVFYRARFPYGDIDQNLKSKMDLVNYRADLLHKAGLNKNKNMVFKVSGYTGAFGYMPKRFTRFISNFGYSPETILIYPGDVPDSERFLDLSAVRYLFNDAGLPMERPSALSRLTLFYSYKVIEDERKTLDLLKDPSFNFREKVLLNQAPKTNGIQPDQWMMSLPKSEFVSIKNSDSDRVEAQVSARAPAILLFGDSYAKGWRAYVDGKQVPIYIANYNFMACAIDPGIHQVKFEFKPELYFFSRAVSLLGLMIFLAGVLFLAFRAKKL
ncbi:MAG TPA: YfhO family protein [Candidatus Omnitrophota bacterium]|nr:YfhO family protein [Candidatus Omnitrophota bacterium]HPD84941.1 YfhO family protein [Candidatus Omnitrophota bacterium]HRZ03799.1 YfhO family protein [Candidatus Omnitrophota bacterium]